MTTPPCIIFTDIPDIVHIRMDAVFTHCGVWLTKPKVFEELELDEPPDRATWCGVCRARWVRANEEIPDILKGKLESLRWR